MNQTKHELTGLVRLYVYIKSVVGVLSIILGYCIGKGHDGFVILVGFALILAASFSIAIISKVADILDEHDLVEMTDPPNIALKNTDDPDAVEHCVICKAETPYKRNTRLDHRRYYIEGSGQLCEKCYKETYGEEGP